jgi:hypothetical protein
VLDELEVLIRHITGPIPARSWPTVGP